jgi:tetratricopeptide (TPR) repeat protein
MKTRTERHKLLLAIAVLMIAGSLAAYCLLFLRWLGNDTTAAPFSPRAPTPPPEALAAARARFREGYLDPVSHLRLAEALYGVGRRVDAFYVIKETREFFGEEDFRRAHERVILRKDSVAAQAEAGLDSGDGAKIDSLLAERPTDPSLLLLKADLTARTDLMGAIPLYARLANSAPDSFEAKRALGTLAKLAQKKDSDPQIEAGRLAQEALQELFKAQPKEPLVFASLATAAWNRGELSAAKALVNEALRKDPAHAGALMVDGMIARSDGDADRAVKEFSAAWDKNPDDLYSAEQLARLYDRERGDPEAALPYYIALYRGDPAEPLEHRIAEILDARRKAVLGRAVEESLSRFLSSDDGSLRAEACARAGAAKDEQWIDALAELLDDDVDMVRHNADYALYQIASSRPESVRERKDAWLRSPRPLLRTRALNLFADLQTAETFPAVEAALNDPDPAVRFLTKTMVFDHYYKNLEAAREVRDKYLAREKDPAVLALYARMGKS